MIVLNEVKIDSISVSGLPKTQYYIGDTFTTSGLSIRPLNNNGEYDDDIWNGYTIQVSGYDEGVVPTFTSAGTKTVTVYYVKGTKRVSTTYEIQIDPVVLTGIEIFQYPSQLRYKIGDELNSDGMIVVAKYNNNKNGEIITSYTCNYDFSSQGMAEVTVQYLGKVAKFNATVEGPLYITAVKQPNKITYEPGETLDLTGLVMKAVYFDSVKILNDDDYTVEAVELSQPGTTSVRISYQGAVYTLQVEINEREIQPTDPQLVIGNVMVLNGETVEVDFVLKNTVPLKSLMLSDFVYDKSKLQIVDDTPGISDEWKVDGGIIVDWDVSEEVATIAFAQNTDINGVIFTIKFKALDDIDPEIIEIGCTISAKEKSSESGEVPVEIAVIYGTVEITDVARGDVNGDDSVDSDDAIYLLRYTLMSDRYPMNQDGDMNGDGVVDSDDAIYLLRYTLMPDPLN